MNGNVGEIATDNEEVAGHVVEFFAIELKSSKNIALGVGMEWSKYVVEAKKVAALFGEI